MIVTNEYNLPKAFVEAAKWDYKVKPNEYRATSLLKGIRETILTRRYQDQIKIDVADQVWALFGTAVHNLLEEQEVEDWELKEQKLKMQVGDYTVSGQYDLYCRKEKMITDYKTASVWKVIHKDFEDWRRQMLIYAVLLRHHGYAVKKGQVVAFLKDHSKAKAARDKDYPKSPVWRHYFHFSERDIDGMEAWIEWRILDLATDEQLPDHELPICSDEERWASPDSYCELYCNVNKFCSFYNDLRGAS